MKKRKISIKDIAKAVNVSVTTVSFVLNGKGREKRISEEVIKKVLSYAEEVNYSPNQIAKSLRTGKSNILVFMVEDISNSFFAKLARIIEILAYEKGYKVIFCSNENKDRRTKELIDLFKDRKIDGYIIIPSPGSKRKIKEMLDENIPVLLFDRYFPDLETNMVIINNEESTYKATSHLINNRFKNIGYITIKAIQTQMNDRLKGYRKAVLEAGLTENVLSLPYNNDKDIQDQLKEYLEEHPYLDALFFSTNYLTQAGLLVLKEHFPEKINDLGLLTFDDNSFFQIHTPSISAVAQPLEQIGQRLMKIMFQLLKENPKETQIQKIVLETELKIRDSSHAKHLV